MAEQRQILLKIQADERQARKDLARTTAELQSVKEQLSAVNKQYKSGEINLKEYGEETAKLKTVQRDLRKEQAQLNKTIDNSVKATRAAEGSNERLKAVLSQLTREYSQLSREQQENTKEGKQLQKTILSITNTLKESEFATGNFRRDVGNYTQALGGLKSEFLSIAGAALGPAGAIAAASGLTDAISTGVQAVSDINEEYREYNGLVQQLTGLVGDQRNGLTGQIVALSEVFEKDFKEVLIAANTVSKEFGITLPDALSEIEKGFLAGNDLTGEYLDILREYPAQIAQTGASFEELNLITNVATSNGIFSDKGLDTVKEALIRIRELPDATAKALDAIGISSVEVERGLREGTTTVFEVVQQVSQRLSELPPQSREVGQALADIFGGPGEDAGLRYITLLKDIEGGLEDVIDPTNTLTQRYIRQLEATENLSRAKAELTQSLNSFGTSTDTIGKNIQAFFINALTNTIKAFQLWGITLEATGAGFRGFAEDVVANFDIVKNNVLIGIDTIRQGFFNLIGDEETANKIGENLKNLVNERNLAEARAVGTSFGIAYNEAFAKGLIRLGESSNSVDSSGGTSSITATNNTESTGTTSGLDIPGLPPLSSIQARADEEVNIEQIKRDRINQIAENALKKGERARKQSADALKRITQEEIAAEQAKLQALQVGAALATQIAGEQTAVGKAFAIGSALVSTWAGAARALKDFPAPLSYAMAASTVANGLASVANIRKVEVPGFSSGGSGVGSGQTGGPLFGGSQQPSSGLTSSTSLSVPVIPNSGSGDVASTVASQQSQESQQLGNLTNAVNQLQFVVGVDEINNAQRRVEVKERVSRFG